MITKMKRLRVMAMAARKEELLKGLLHLGCVEISEPEARLSDPEWAALLRREAVDLTKTKGELADAHYCDECACELRIAAPEFRICDVCGDLMVEGYCSEDGGPE